MNEVPVAAPVPAVKNLLAYVENLLGHQGRMTTFIKFSFVREHAGVVRVTENFGQRTRRHGTRRAITRATTRQPHILKKRRELPHRVAVRRVLLESEPDERSSFLIQADRVDKTTTEVFAIVDVTELGSPDRSAVDRLVAHFLFDVLAALTDLDFVHDVGDSFHGVSHVALTEILFRGDELDAHTGQDPLGDRRVSEVPKSPRAHIYNYETDFGMLLDVPQHLPENRPLSNRLR